MPPEDSLFNEPAPEATEPTETEAPAVGLTRADVDALLAPLQDQLSSTKEQLAVSQEAQRALEARQNTPAPTPVEEDLSGEDYLNALADAPKDVIGREVEAQVQARLRQLEPFFEQQNNTMHSTILNNEKATIDAEFGPGTFDAEFSTLMNARVSELRTSNPQALSDPSVIAMEVQSIKGHKFDALVKRRADFITTGEEAKSTERQQILDEFRMSGLSGGHAPPPQAANAPLSDAEKDFIASKQLAGQTVDIKSLRLSLARDGQQSNYPTREGAA